MDSAAATALARQIQVRHREPGHLRLELPPALLGSLPELETALRRVCGVYRVLPEGRRLAIRFDPGLCTEIQVARALKAALLELPESLAANPTNPEPTAAAMQPGLPAGLGQLGQQLGSQLLPLLSGTGRTALGLLQELGQRLGQAARPAPTAAPGRDAAQPADTGQSAGPDPASHDLGQRLQGLVQGALTERAAINFLNDILAFYLIKVHWDLITRRWLKEPLKFANAWLTVFYLVFLLVRYRKQAPKP
ncbi:hypothetical protein [Azovibrio restrictus]|uniref:hypothetical protein n=1 Tax=Azovibrio restrictus TaxID=146938 RepID=UPI0026EE3166|nr:hypothetical protein [Azovibrio restrictus]MDD3482165.1 hypothetical protein [Azovibrio restrictus]